MKTTIILENISEGSRYDINDMVKADTSSLGLVTLLGANDGIEIVQIDIKKNDLDPISMYSHNNPLSKINLIRRI